MIQKADLTALTDSTVRLLKALLIHLTPDRRGEVWDRLMEGYCPDCGQTWSGREPCPCLWPYERETDDGEPAR